MAITRVFTLVGAGGAAVGSAWWVVKAMENTVDFNRHIATENLFPIPLLSLLFLLSKILQPRALPPVLFYASLASMINLTSAKLLTAKLLLFVALTLGPKEMTHSIQITSNNINYQWVQGTGDWTLIETGQPSQYWPANGVDMSKKDLMDLGKENIQSVRNIAHHDWRRDSVLILDNGDRVEKCGNKVFYTARPGDANQQVYTILYIEDGKPL